MWMVGRVVTESSRGWCNRLVPEEWYKTLLHGGRTCSRYWDCPNNLWGRAADSKLLHLERAGRCGKAIQVKSKTWAWSSLKWGSCNCWHPTVEFHPSPLWQSPRSCLLPSQTQEKVSGPVRRFGELENPHFSSSFILVINLLSLIKSS